MKFYELDLQQIIPYGIPLNTENHVEYSGSINDFFLKGFENYFHRLYTLNSGDELVRDYSRSCTSPASIYACNFCNDSQLQTAITEAGFTYYPTNDHDINAEFLFRLNRIPFGTSEYATAITQYVSNSNDVFAEMLYDGYDAYNYGIRLYGDISGSVNNATICQRLLENLQLLGTAHTRLDEIWFEDTSSDITNYAACYADDVSISCEIEIAIPVSQPITIGVTTTVPSGAATCQSPYWWMYHFSGGQTLSNLWQPDYFESGVTGDTTLEVVPGDAFAEAYYDGLATPEGQPSYALTIDFAFTGNTLRLTTYSSKPEFYTDTSTRVDKENSALIVMPATGCSWTTKTAFDLPSDLYTISGTSITWNTSHALYNILYGKQGTVI